MIVINGVDNVFLFILPNLPHGPTHHVTRCIWSDGETMPLTLEWKKREGKEGGREGKEGGREGKEGRREGGREGGRARQRDSERQREHLYTHIVHKSGTHLSAGLSVHI